jgi:hypothetical protein
MPNTVVVSAKAETHEHRPLRGRGFVTAVFDSQALRALGRDDEEI